MRSAMPDVCILAGGLGTRLGETSRTTPKALVQVAGRPFLVHQMRLLQRQGLQRAVVCVGHLGKQIEEVIGTECEGVSVQYSYDGPGLDGTLGAVRRAAPLLGDRFLVMYGDTYLTLPFLEFHREWEASSLPGGMTVYRNEGRHDRSNVLYRSGRVELYDKESPTPGMQWIDYGLGALTVEALGAVPPPVRDLADLYHHLSSLGELFGYEVAERFYEIGTPEALAETNRYLMESGV